MDLKYKPKAAINKEITIIKVAIALISGLIPLLRIPCIKTGKVVEFTPAIKYVITKSSKEMIKANNPNAPVIWGIDSTSLLRSEDQNCIIVTASHGALFGSADNRLIANKPLAMVFNDAGIGIDQWGISRLKHLDKQGILAVTVGCNSARIGDSRSAWKTGIISCTNTEAANAGIQVGETLEDLADKLASTI